MNRYGLSTVKKPNFENLIQPVLNGLKASYASGFLLLFFSEHSIVKGHVNLQNANFSGHIVIKYTFSVCGMCKSFFKTSAFSVGKGCCKFKAPAILITPSSP